MDVWAAIIAGFKAASPGKVTVLGSIDSSTTVSEYDDLDMDGFYFVGTDVQTRHYRRALTSPLRFHDIEQIIELRRAVVLPQ